MPSEPSDDAVNHLAEHASTTEGLPVAVSMGPVLDAAAVPAQRALVDRRVVFISALSILIAAVAAFVAQGLILLIQLITDVAFFGHVSFAPISPAANHLGPWVIAVPVLGGLIVGAMARYGSEAIRGHGIPEAMEQILTNESRIRPRLTFLKPLSAAIAIGTGGPFGAEGPIIATGGAVGSVVGQVLRTTAAERKTLLAAGAAAGMFAGASRAMLASVVFAFETTLQPLGLLPLLGGCTAAFLISALLMRYTIMTEKIVRRGICVPEEYAADYLANVLVRDAMSSSPVTLKADQTLDDVRQWIAARAPGSGHQGFPVVDAEGHVVGVLTRRDLLDTAHPARARLHDLIQRFPIVIYGDRTLREAADHMVSHDVGRLPVIDASSGRLVGMLTRSDVLSAHRRRLRELTEAERVLALRSFLPRWPGHRAAG